jgi:2',3'-cyclic-nucleotide 2'-phosphodiesterase (5'-nucleotidase family)
LDDKGIHVTGIFNKSIPNFDMIWNMAKDGFLDGLSIEYRPVDYKTVEKNGEQVRLLNKVLLKGYAHTPRPMNPNCKLTDVFTKSLTFDSKTNEKKVRTMEENDSLKSEITTLKEENRKLQEELKANQEELKSYREMDADKKLADKVKSIVAEEIKKAVTAKPLVSDVPEEDKFKSEKSEKKDEAKSYSFYDAMTVAYVPGGKI